MHFLLIILLCILSTTKVTIQSRFGKKMLSTRADGIIYNAAVFFTAAILFCVDIPSASSGTWLFASAFALFTVIFQLSYTNALSLGNVSLTVMLINLSMLLPVLLSVIVYNEHLTLGRIIGILLTVTSFILCVDTKTENRMSRSWLFLTVASILANGSIGVTQKIFGASVFHNEKKEFVACSYMIAFLITIALYTVVHIKEKNSTAYKKIPTYLFAASTGIVLAIFQWVNIYAISVMDGSFLFPIYSGGSIILSTLVGVLFFSDKLTSKQKISMGLGMIAVVIMNL